MRARVILRRTRRRILAVGAIVLLLGVLTMSTYRCFGNFAFGGVTCSLWGITPFPEVAGLIISWGLITAGVVILLVALLAGAPFVDFP